MSRKTFSETGRVVIEDGSILIEGFEWSIEHRDGLPTCRDHARAAMIWALARLAEELERDSSHDWENYKAAIG